MVDKALIDKAVDLLGRKLDRGTLPAKIAVELSRSGLFPGQGLGELISLAIEIKSRLPVSVTMFEQNSYRPGTEPAARRRFPATPTPTAPYRFITLEDTVAAGVKIDRSKPQDGGVCATIKVRWVAESPLLIGQEGENGQIKPMRLGPNGPFIIPGASLKGMVRAATEIVALGRLGFANLHHRYGLRDFDHAYYSGQAILEEGKVKAGWLRMTKNGREKTLRLTPLGDEWSKIKISEIGLSDPDDWIEKKLDEKYRCLGIDLRGNTFNFEKKFKFIRSDTDCHLVEPSSPGAEGVDGFFVFSGKAPKPDSPEKKKKYEYVFFDAGEAESVPISPEKQRLFERLYSKPSRNRPEPDGSWKVLLPTLRAGRRIPVFYVGDPIAQGEDFFFGLTRLFKIPHKRSVEQVVEKSHSAHYRKPDFDTESDFQPDFVENLFGYVAERDEVGVASGARLSSAVGARKGRIAFGFAFLDADQPPPREADDTVSVVQLAPRASYAPFYLRGRETKDYSSDAHPRLAGRKRYMARTTNESFEERRQAIRDMGADQPGLANVRSDLRFLMPAPGRRDIRFTSDIRLHNVSEAELGAILFVLTHGGYLDGRGRHMIGRAKPFGAGQLRAEITLLTVTPNATGKAENGASLARYLEAFVKHMKTVDPRYPRIPSIEEFLGTALPTAKLQLDYMNDVQDFGKIRKEVKPLRFNKRENQPGRPPAVMSHEEHGDDRILPTPRFSIPKDPHSDS